MVLEFKLRKILRIQNEYFRFTWLFEIYTSESELFILNDGNLL